MPPAQQLTEIFGVGRSSTREAVRALGVLGYLEILPGQGTFIKKDSSSEEISVKELMNAGIQAFFRNLFRPYTKTGKGKGVIKGNEVKFSLL